MERNILRDNGNLVVLVMCKKCLVEFKEVEFFLCDFWFKFGMMVIKGKLGCY